MSNMSYCRFRNTLKDLRDCAENIMSTDLSPDEAEARIALINVALDMLDELGIETDLNGQSVKQRIIIATEE